MVRDVKELHNRYRIEQEKLDIFDRVLVAGHTSEWWRLFVEQIRDRMNDFLMMLVNGGMDDKDENKLRGQILECSFVLTLDERAKGLNKEKEMKINKEEFRRL